MVTIKNWHDCLNRSAATGIAPEVLAELYDINNPEQEKEVRNIEDTLADTDSIESRFNLLAITSRSDLVIREVILKNILINATNQAERFNVLYELDNNSELQEKALREILENSTTQEERFELLEIAPELSDIWHEINRSISENADS